MLVIVDRNLCIGAASCVAIAPNTFRLDDENKAVVVEIGKDDKDAVIAAAQSCPTLAITVIDDDGTQIYP